MVEGKLSWREVIGSSDSFALGAVVIRVRHVKNGEGETPPIYSTELHYILVVIVYISSPTTRGSLVRKTLTNWMIINHLPVRQLLWGIRTETAATREESGQPKFRQLSESFVWALIDTSRTLS